MKSNESVSRNTGSNATMPRHHWMHEVMMAAGVSAEVAEARRERLVRWFNAGEPVWIAADSLRILVRERAVWDRYESDRDAAKAWIRYGNQKGEAPK